jgi:hypothetical protein
MSLIISQSIKNRTKRDYSYNDILHFIRIGSSELIPDEHYLFSSLCSLIIMLPLDNAGEIEKVAIC